MPELRDSRTHENLKHAFAGESQANRRYLYFARRAEGYPEIGGLFRDTTPRLSVANRFCFGERRAAVR
jgi:rubrerythrin